MDPEHRGAAAGDAGRRGPGRRTVHACSWARTSRPAAPSSSATPGTSASSTSSRPDVPAAATAPEKDSTPVTDVNTTPEPADSPATASSRSTSRPRCSAAISTTRCRSSSRRALPDVRDGLKPVHRRVLYAMYDGGYRPDRGYFKCARVVGDVMGNYHPHGDSSIYDTLVRLAQPWSMRYAAGRRQRQLRLSGQRPGGGHALHRVQAGAAGHGDAARTSTRRPSTSGPTTTAAPRSPSSCRHASRTCWSTARPASRSAWPPTSRRTTCARWPRASVVPARTPRPPTRSSSTR